MSRFLLTLGLFLSAGPAFAQWQAQTIGTDADFRGLNTVSNKVAWVSGTKGTVGRTVDGGKTWQLVNVPDAAKLDFRDVEAFDESTAYVLSIGPGADSRIYKTLDGGQTWKRQFQNADKDAFYDAIAFWDPTHGVAVSDPVRGRYRLVGTDDGGATWKPLPTDGMPEAEPKEGAFAASGTCLVAAGENDLWFVTGGAKAARLFHSTDRGRNWTVQDSPIAGGVESAGGFGIGFRDRERGIIVGGDYRKPKDVGATAAVTRDGGKSWQKVDGLPFRSAVAWAKDRWVAVGTSGSHVSLDDGKTWKELDRENYNAASFVKSGHGWAAGPKGRVAKFVLAE